MKSNPIRDNAGGQPGEVGKTENPKPKYKPAADLFPESLSPVVSAPRSTPPIVSGQTAQVLDLIRKNQPILSFVLTADHAIPEAAARVHDLRAIGFHVQTRIESTVIFRGCERRNAAFYSLGTPEWPAPGFFGGGV